MSLRRYLAPDPRTLAELLAADPQERPVLAEELRAQLLGGLRVPAGSGRPRRLDAVVVERGSEAATRPFRWSARTARRSLGRRAARSVATGQLRDALVAARAEVERQCDRARCGLERRGGLGSWLASSTAAVREQCAMDAASWAHELLALTRPEATGIDVGLADAWFEVPGARTTLHARRDATTEAGVLRLRDGVAPDTAERGLAVDGLIVGLGTGSVPKIVVGCWPDAGQVVALEMCPRAIESAVSSLLEVAPPLDSSPRVLVAA